jgi:hypothetical protein
VQNEKVGYSAKVTVAGGLRDVIEARPERAQEDVKALTSTLVGEKTDNYTKEVAIGCLRKIAKVKPVEGVSVFTT